MVCVCSTLANLISACATSPGVRMHTHTRCDAEALPGPPTCCLQPACLSSCSTTPQRAWIPAASPGRWHPVRAALGAGDPLPSPQLPCRCAAATTGTEQGSLPPSEPPRAIPAGSRGRLLPALQRAQSLAPREELLGSPNQIPYLIWGSRHWTLPLQHILRHRTPNRCQRVKVL